MKITMYELFELVKDGKAPKKIKYRNIVYHINYDVGDYESDIKLYRYNDYEEPYYLFEEIDIFKCLNDEVEILEEEKKIPEKLEDYDFDDSLDANTKCECLRERMQEIENQLDEIIDYLKSKGE